MIERALKSWDIHPYEYEMTKKRKEMDLKAVKETMYEEGMEKGRMEGIEKGKD